MRDVAEDIERPQDQQRRHRVRLVIERLALPPAESCRDGIQALGRSRSQIDDVHRNSTRDRRSGHRIDDLLRLVRRTHQVCRWPEGGDQGMDEDAGDLPRDRLERARSCSRAYGAY